MAAKAPITEKGVSNVSVVHGHSVLFLESFEQEVCNKDGFFLDAPYSTGITSKSFGNYAIIAEISTVAPQAPDALIVVDDVRTTDSRRGCPTLHEILDSITGCLEARIKFD